MIHARFYSAESDDERYEKSAAVNAFNRYCGGGGSSSLWSSIVFSISSTSDVVHCWIFTSDIFIPNDPIPSYDMVNLENDSMLGIGGEDTNIDKG